MKYLKTFEALDSEEDFLQDIKEILLEVEDIGYRTMLDTTSVSDYIRINRFDQSGKSTINFEEIKDCLFRLKDYLGDRYNNSEMWSLEGNFYLDLTEAGYKHIIKNYQDIVFTIIVDYKKCDEI